MTLGELLLLLNRGTNITLMIQVRSGFVGPGSKLYLLPQRGEPDDRMLMEGIPYGAKVAHIEPRANGDAFGGGRLEVWTETETVSEDDWGEVGLAETLADGVMAHPEAWSEFYDGYLRRIMGRSKGTEEAEE